MTKIKYEGYSKKHETCQTAGLQQKVSTFIYYIYCWLILILFYQKKHILYNFLN